MDQLLNGAVARRCRLRGKSRTNGWKKFIMQMKWFWMVCAESKY